MMWACVGVWYNHIYLILRFYATYIANIIIRMTGTEAATPIFDHLMWRTDSFAKTVGGKDWRQEEKGTTEDA